MLFEVILSLGTLLVLVFQGWILWRQTKIINSQKDISEKQTVYLMRKEDPQIEVQTKDYSEDKIILNLINLGKTKAVGVALKTEVYLVNLEVKKERDKMLISSVGDWDFKKQCNIKDGEKIYSLEPIISEIFHDKSNYPELEINQNHKFIHEIHFGLFDKKEKIPVPVKNIAFKQLIQLLKSNTVLGCEIKISLIYKNLSNQVVEEIQVDKFYIMPISLEPKFLSELKESEKLKGGMKYVPIHPFLKQELNLPKSENTYRDINHCQR
ncbi:MAG: hypothetical protein WC796_03660 [Candidatus Pacearchaeota archaeon]|jgi:hypothetical protein